MRTLFHLLIGITVISILASCGGKNTLEAKKAKLEKLGKLRRYLGEFNDIARLLAADKKKSLRSQFEDWDAILSRAKKRQTALRQKLKKRL